MSVIDTSQLILIERFLDLATVRQSLLVSNIANVDTPGYRTKDIDFAAALKQASDPPESQTLGSLLGLNSGSDQLKQDPEVIETQGLAIRNDGNNVNPILSFEKISLLDSASTASTETIKGIHKYAFQLLSVLDNKFPHLVELASNVSNMGSSKMSEHC